MATETLDSVVGLFIAKAGPIQDPTDLLKGFVAFLKSRGQYVEPGEIQKQFTEVRQVKDRAGVPIEIAKCLVCGHEEFLVKEA